MAGSPRRRLSREVRSVTKPPATTALALGLECVNWSQIIMCLPVLLMFTGSIVAHFLKIGPDTVGGLTLAQEVLVARVGNYVYTVLLFCPLVVLLAHQAAALHAREVCLKVNQILKDYNEEWDDRIMKQMKAEQARQGGDGQTIEAVGLPSLCAGGGTDEDEQSNQSTAARLAAKPDVEIRWPEDVAGDPIWDTHWVKWACHLSYLPITSTVQLVLLTAASFIITRRVGTTLQLSAGIAIVPIALILYASTIALSRGLLQSKRESTARYVSGSFQSRVMLGVIFAIFMSVYAIVIGCTIPTVVWEGSNLPSRLECRAVAFNQTYRSVSCSPQANSFALESWQIMSSGWSSALDCRDFGGWTPYKSIIDACTALLAGQEVLLRRAWSDMVTQVLVVALFILTEHVYNAGHGLTTTNFISHHSLPSLKLAIVFMYAGSLGVFMGIALMLVPGNTELLYKISDQLVNVFCGFLGAAALVLTTHLLVQRFTNLANKASKNYFISYKQDDQNDGAVQMFYWQLHSQPAPAPTAWLDKYADERDANAMRQGVKDCDVFVAVLSPQYFSSWFCCLELHTAIRRVHHLEMSLKSSQNEIAEWKGKYEEVSSRWFGAH